MGINNELKLLKIEDVHNFNLKGWNSAFASKSQATIAHNFSIGLVLEKTYNFKFEPFKIVKGNDIIGFLPFSRIGTKLVSMPHFSYGGWMQDNAVQKEEINALIKQLDCDDFEIRSFEICSPHFSDDKVTCYLKLEDSPDSQMKAFKSKLRSQIRKGTKNGLTHKMGGYELLNTFYTVYSRNMHDLGSPVLSKKFFENLLKDYKDGCVNIHVIYSENIAIGVGFVLGYHSFMEVCWASTLKKYNYLQPNMTLYWEMISSAIEKKKEIFSFGRCTANSGTHKFKRQWGCFDVPIFFNYKKKRGSGIKKFSGLMGLWQKLPYQLTLFLGPIITKRIY